MKQAPVWLPYQVRSKVDQYRINRAVRGLSRTAPTPALSPQDADGELHMLLCRRDLRIGLLALKSLLRFDRLRLAVRLTDDGTLSRGDRAMVDRQVPNCRWLSWPVRQRGELDRALAGRSRLAALYDSSYAPVCKLLHATLLARCDRVIVQDPDTAFFEHPQRIAGWLSGDNGCPLYLHDHQDESRTVPDIVHQAFGELERYLAPNGRKWRLQYRLFNSGLLMFEPRLLDLDLAERYLAWRESAPRDYRTGKAAIWFGDWTPEQTCYHVMFALSDPPPAPLGDAYHLGGDAGHVFNHFLRHYLVQGRTLRMIRGLVAQL